MLTYQDFISEGDRGGAIGRVVGAHLRSEGYLTALDADEYDRQRNVTINRYVRLIRDRTNNPMVDITAANNRIASNFFHRLNTQRCAYLLGNGVTFTREGTKARLGARFDQDLFEWAYRALIHGVGFGFWNVDRLHVFGLTEFAPLWDEETGALRAGIRFWRVDRHKPMMAVLYEAAGYSTWRDGRLIEGPLPYPGLSGQLPVVPLWGSRLRQSTLIGMREKIDSYDLIQSGFANDLTDCAQIYWLIENCGGMSEADLQAFLDNLRFRHIAMVDTRSFDGDSRASLSPYVQDVPYQGRQAYLEGMRASIYEDFGGLDVHAIAAGSTNDHIDAAYQPMDEEADQLELQVIDGVQGVLGLMGIEDTPLFKRNRISNLKEQVEAVALEAPYLDQEAILALLPNVSVDMREGILRRRVKS